MNNERILIGSTAINYHSPNNFIRTPDDLDYFLCGENQAPIKNKRFDAHGIPSHIFDLIKKRAGTKTSRYSDVIEYIPSLDVLYTIKLSHSTFPIKWQKTAHDILWIQKHYSGCTVYNADLHRELYNFWLKVHSHNKHKINLNKSNEEFFEDNVKRTFVHDDIHKAMSYPEYPMYMKMKNDIDKASISNVIFSQASFQDQLKLCQEEIMVTALERFLIPNDFNILPVKAYRMAIEKLVTSMTRGWFPTYIMDHLKLLCNPPEDMIFKFYDAVKGGRIRKL